MEEKPSEDKPSVYSGIKKSKKINYLIIAVILALALFSIWTFRLRPVETRELMVNFSVGATPGITVDTDKLYFGRIIPGGAVVREINIENGYDYPLKLKISASPNVREYLSIDQEYIIKPGEKAKIPINIVIPENTPYGDYEGKIRFDLVKA